MKTPRPTAFVVRVYTEVGAVAKPIAIFFDIDAAKLHAESVCQTRRGFSWDRSTKGYEKMRHLTLLEPSGTGTRALAHVTECPVLDTIPRVIELPPDPGSVTRALARR